MMKKIKSKRTIALLSMTAAFALTAGLGAAFLPRTSARAEDIGSTLINLDFSEDDGGAFTPHSGQPWKVEKGVYYATKDAIIKSNQKFDISDTTYFSFDFYAAVPNFDVLLTPNFTWSMGDGLGIHVYPQSEEYDRLNVNSNIDITGWIGDSVGKYSGGDTWHNMKIEIKDETFKIFVDNAPITFGAMETIPFTGGSGDGAITSFGENKEAQICFRSTSEGSWIDNLIVSNSDIPYVAPTGPSEDSDPSTGEPLVNVDFAEGDGGIFTAHSGGGWRAEKEVYYPAAAGAITKTATTYDLSKKIYFSFDFYATAVPFDVYLTPDLNNGYTQGGGFGIHLYSNNTLTVNAYMDQDAWIGEIGTNYVDDKAHNMKIKVENEEFSIYVDNALVTFNNGGMASIPFTSVKGTNTSTQITTEAFKDTKVAQVCFRAADTESWIDNFIVSNSDIEYVAPVGPSQEGPEPPAGDVSVDIDFDSDTGVDDVFEGYDGKTWTVDSENGVYHASEANAVTKTKEKYDISTTIFFSFDFYVTAAPFDVYLTPDLETKKVRGGGLGIHVFSSPSMTLTVNAAFGQDAWIGEIGTNYVDGKARNMKIKVADQAFSIYVDNVLVAFNTNNGSLASIPFTGGSGDGAINAFNDTKVAQVCFQAADTTSYIDNFKVSSGNIPYVEPDQPPVPPEVREEIDLAFDGAADDAYFMNALSSGGWKSAGNGGKFHPVAPWATTQLKQSIATNEGETYISFDFFAGEYDLSTVKSGWTWTNVQFNVALLPDPSEPNGGIGIHAFYADDSGTAVLTVTDGLGRNWIADYPFDWHDNKEHNLKMKVAEGKVSFRIDNTQISASVDGVETTEFEGLTEDKVYFLMSSVSTMTSIDNFKLKFEDIAYTAPVQPELVPVEETFDEGSDAFEGGWNVADGVLNSSGWDLGWYKNRIPLNGTSTILFEFKATEPADSPQFNFGLVRGTPQASIVSNPALAFHAVPANTSVSNTFSNSGLLVIDTINLNLLDGETHTVKMVVQGGKLSVAIDDTVLMIQELKAIPLDMDAAYFTVQAGNCTVTLDNFEVRSGAVELSKPDGSNDVTYEDPSASTPEPAPVEATTTKPDRGLMIGAIVCGVAVALLATGLVLVLVLRKKKK